MPSIPEPPTVSGASRADRSCRARAWWLGALATTAIVVAFLFDARLVETMRGVSRPVERAFSKVSKYGDWPYLAGAGVLLLGAATRLGRADARRLLLCMLVASTVGGIAANVGRGLTGRARPEADKKGVAPGWYGVRHEGEWLIGKHRYNSFPSSHSAAAAGFFGVLFFARRRVLWIAGLLLVPPVPLARLVMNQHHLSDVVVGTGLGILAAWWVVTRWGERLDAWWMRGPGRKLVGGGGR